jgi:hypothetical protein
VPLIACRLCRLKTLEAGFGLPCLNRPCDTTSKVMTDQFGLVDRD